MSIRHTIKKIPGFQRLAGLRAHFLPQLHKRLPLPLPLSMHIEPTNACNLRCRFCPTGDPALLATVNRPTGYMEIDVFRKICAEVASMIHAGKDALEILHLYKDGEPLLHRDFLSMVAIAKQSGIADVIATTTNGILVDGEMAHSLMQSGLDRIRFSLKPREYYGTDRQFEKVIENIRFLYEEKKRRGIALVVQIQVIPKLMGKQLGSQPLLPALRSMCDELTCNNLMGWSYSDKKDFTLGSKPRRSMDDVTPLREILVCPEPFSKLAVNWNGSVSVCCVDWSWGTVVGNVTTSRLDEIWNGGEMREFRRLHLEGMRSAIGACGNCQYVLGTPGHCVLDNVRKKLLPMYS